MIVVFPTEILVRVKLAVKYADSMLSGRSFGFYIETTTNPKRF